MYCRIRNCLKQRNRLIRTALLLTASSLWRWSIAFGSGEQILEGIDTASGLPRNTCITATVPPPPTNSFQLSGYTHVDGGKTVATFLSRMDFEGSVNLAW